jgi:hypothetical protein
MASLSEKISSARSQGYSDAEIVQFITDNNLSSKVTESIKTGASPTEILDAATAGRPTLERAGRIPGLAARGALPIAAGAAIGAPFGPPGMLAGSLAVPAAEALTQLYNMIAPQKYQIPTPMQGIESLGTMIGLPKAETLPEQMIQAAGGGVAAPIAQIPGAARLATTALTPTGREVARVAAAQPSAQIVAGGVAAPVGEAVGEVTESPVAGMIASMLTGGAVGARRGEQEVAPTRAAVRTESQNAYDRATQAGVIVSPNSLQNAVQGITQQVTNAGFDAGLHPRVAAVLNRLQQEGQQPRTLDELEILRRVASGAAASNERDERRLGRIIVGQIDRYVNNLGAPDLVAGNQAGIGELRTARNLWSRNAKADVFEQMVDRAQTTGGSVYTQSGYENALRGEFRRLANNDTRMRQFTADEQTEIRQIARGGNIQNILRIVGKFSPTSVIAAPLSAGTGYVVGGPAAAVALPVTGLAARRASEQMMQRQVDDLINQILMGRPLQRGEPTMFNIPAAGRGLLAPQIEVE